ncbi:MAG: uracil-DNA glycosylase [Candidatus Riflebacteria bacterium]|nr:uracil-DNA glycosylase [Candidatus Riflebacteria bacterium]
MAEVIPLVNSPEISSGTPSGSGPINASGKCSETLPEKYSGSFSESSTKTPEKISEQPSKSPGKKLPISKPLENQNFSLDSFDSTDSFEKIKADALTCTGCSLCKTRTNVVMGEGSDHALLVFIGEAPGEDEDLSGRPFVGKAGKHLDKILAAAGISREEVFICNILKDRPPDNRTPTIEEMQACTPFLRRQLNLLKPRLIGLLGNTAIKFVIGPKTPGVTTIHGQWFDSIFGIPCMPLYHPSYLLRNASRAQGSPNWQMWQDIQELKKRYDEIKTSK